MPRSESSPSSHCGWCYQHKNLVKWTLLKPPQMISGRKKTEASRMFSDSRSHREGLPQHSIVSLWFQNARVWKKMKSQRNSMIVDILKEKWLKKPPKFFFVKHMQKIFFWNHIFTRTSNEKVCIWEPNTAILKIHHLFRQHQLKCSLVEMRLPDIPWAYRLRNDALEPSHLCVRGNKPSV